MKRFGRRLAILAALVVVVGGSFTWGFFVHRDKVFPYQLVRRVIYWSTWHRMAPERSWGEARDAVRAPGDLAALPYLPGYEPASGESGVTVHDPESAAHGLNLYTSGHDTVALLVDMDGRELHRWSLDPITAWADHAPPMGAELVYPEWGYWRRAHAFPDGGLLVIYESAGMLKLDADSNVEWAFWGGCHHDLEVAPDGTIRVLGKSLVDAPELGRDEPVIDDTIYTLDPAGRVLGEVSVLQCLLRSDYAPLLDLAPPGDPDILHSNTVRLLDGRFAEVHPAFAAGNILTSMRTLNTIAVIDPDRREVVWALSGQWAWQHDPVLVDPGRVLLFDNRPDTGASRVVEVDPLLRSIEWSYRSPGFSSDILGAVQRLPGGTTLITESTHGRAFEVTPEGRIVWELVNPNRAGDNDELIATLFDLHRYPPDYFDFL